MRYIVKEQVNMGGALLFQIWDTEEGKRVGFPVYFKEEAEQTAYWLNRDVMHQ